MPNITRLNIMILACLCRHWLTSCHQDDEPGDYLPRWCPASCTGPHASENLSGFWLKVSTLLFSLRSQAHSRESGTAENSDKKVAFLSRSGLSPDSSSSLSRISIISLVSPRNLTYLYDPWVAELAPHLEGLGWVSPPAPLLVNIPLTAPR